MSIRGFTDGMGTVLTGQEDDEEESLLQTVGGSVATQWDVGVTEYDGGPAYAPAPEPVYQEPAYDPWSDEQAYVPPAPDMGSSYFEEAEVGFTEYDGGPAYAPPPPVPSGSSFFEPTPESDFMDSGQDPFFAPDDGLTTNLDYFGTDFDAWLDTELNKAVGAGDQQGYNDLIALFNQQGEGPPDLQTRGYMDQIGSPVNYAANPYGFYGLDRADVRDEVLPGQAAYERYAQQQRDSYGLPNFAGQGGDPFASGQMADDADFNLMMATDPQFARPDSRLAPLLGRGFGAIGDAASALGAVDIAPGISTRTALGAAWTAFVVPAEYAWQGLSYASSGGRYLVEQAVRETGLPEGVVSFLGSGFTGASEYRDTGSLRGTVEASYEAQPTYIRVLGETITDPWNLVGVGVVRNLAEAATRGAKTSIVRSSTEELLKSGLVSEQLVADFVATKPSWKVVNELTYSGDAITGILTAQSRIPTEDIANQALSKRLVMEIHNASRGIDATDPVAVQRSIEATRRRVTEEITREVETRYGVQAAVQAQRQLDTPAVQQIVQVIANPNTIPLSNGQLVVVRGNQLVASYAPGSRMNQFTWVPDPPARQRTTNIGMTGGLSTRQTLPTGLTRLTNGDIVTVSRKMATDATDGLESVRTLLNERRIIAPQLTLPLPTGAPDATLAATLLPDPVVTTLLPPAPVRATADAIDMGAGQRGWLELFSQRDGINYFDEIVAGGDTSRDAVIAKIAEINASGKATTQQMAELKRFDLPPSRIRELADRPAREVQAEITRLRRAQQPAPMTSTDYEQLYPDPRQRPYPLDDVMIVSRRSQSHGVDFLRRAIDEGWDRDQLMRATDGSVLPATPLQRKTLRSMVDQGTLPKNLDIDSATTDQASRMIATKRPVDGIVAREQYNVDAPLDLVDEADFAAQRVADAVITAKKKSQEFVRNHFPQFEQPPVSTPGFKRVKAGKTVQRADQGVPVMSPLAVKQWATDVAQAGTLKGTAFEPVIEQMSMAAIHMSMRGGRPVLSESTASTYFELLIDDLVAMVARADVDDSDRLVRVLDAAYNGPRYSEITARATLTAKGLDAAEFARRAEQARSMKPGLEADLAAVNARLDPEVVGRLDPRNVRDLQAQKAKLDEQLARTNAYIDTTTKQADTARQTKEARLQESSAKARDIQPTIGERPPFESDRSMAGLASTHDLADGLLNGRVPAREANPVVPARGKKGAASNATASWRASIPAGTQQTSGAGAGATRAVPVPLGVSPAEIARWSPADLSRELATVDAVIADRAAGGTRTLRSASRRGVGDEDLELAAYREALSKKMPARYAVGEGAADDLFERYLEPARQAALSSKDPTVVFGVARASTSITPKALTEQLGVTKEQAELLLRQMEVEGFVGPRNAYGARKVSRSAHNMTFTTLRDHPEWTTKQKASRLRDVKQFTNADLRILSKTFPAGSDLDTPDYRLLERELMRRGLPNRTTDSNVLALWLDETQTAMDNGAAVGGPVPAGIREAAERLEWPVSGKWTPIWSQVEADDQMALYLRLDEISSRQLTAQYDIGVENPNKGLGSTGFRKNTAQEDSDRIGDLMSKYSKPGKPMPAWVRKEINRLENRRTSDGRLADDVDSWDAAAGLGGYATIDAATFGLAKLVERPQQVAMIEPDVDLWRTVDWNAVGPQLDAYVKQFYDVTDILNADKRLRIKGVALNPADLTRRAKVALAGDAVAFDLGRYVGEARDVALGGGDEYEYMRALVQNRVSGQIEDLAQSDEYFKTEMGAEAARLWKRAGQTVLDNWDAIRPHGSLTDFGLQGVFPAPVNGVYKIDQIRSIDTIINGRRTPPNLTQEARNTLRDLRNSTIKDDWNEKIRPLFYQTGTGWTGKTARVADIDSVLFNHGADVVDTKKLAERIGTAMSNEYARLNNFDPAKTPRYAVPMLWVKAQLSPIWMTMMPGYHMNNLFGNFGAMVMETLRGRGATSIRGVVNPKGMDGVGVLDNDLQGWSLPRWIGDESQGQSQFTESAVAAGSRNAQGKHRPALLGAKGVTVIPNTATMIDAATGSRFGWRGAASTMEDFGELVEGSFKKAIWSQNAFGFAAPLWRTKLDTMMQAGRLTPADVDKLVMAKGLQDVRQIAPTLATSGALDELLAGYRGVIGTAQYKAYTIAADAMRDYRMRNKIDHVLDQFMPIHFWATKNMLYMTRAAMDRPALALSAAQGYDAWIAEHQNDPLSMAQGYLKVPAEMIPFLPEGSDYWMRLTQVLNPVTFAVPKLVKALNRDASNRPEDQSIGEMVQYWSKNGLADFWEASGYRLGPQWDWAIKANNRLDTTPQTVTDGLNWINAPYTTRDGKRQAGQQNVLPLGGLESVLRLIPGKDPIWGQSINDGVKWLNTLATGSPYTNYEVSQAVLWMKQDTAVSFSEANQSRLDAALLALARGEYDDPYIQQAMGNVLKNSGIGWARSRIGMQPGRERTETNQRVDNAWAFYNSVKETSTETARMDPSVLWQLPAELRWMIRDSGATEAQIEAALAAARQGKDHPLFKRAYEATGGEDWVLADQSKFYALMTTGERAWAVQAEKYGKQAANDTIFGTYNRATGQRENGILPGMAALMTVYKDDPNAMLSDIVIDTARENGYALRDRRMREGREERRKETPYFDKLADNDAALRTQVAKAGDNMRLVDLAYKSHAVIESRIYDEAEAAGLDLSGSGNLPREGQNFYTRTPEQKQFLEWNGALEAVEGAERKQARQGFILGLVEEQLGVKKYIDGELNPAFETDGRFDKDKYDAAVFEAADAAPGVFREIVEQYRTMSGEYVEMGVKGTGITRDDFMVSIGSENAKLDAWREQRSADLSAYYDLPAETDADFAARDAEAQRLKQAYGEEILDRRYKDTETATAGENRRYTEAIRAIDTWYSSLSPADKSAIKEQYPDAFAEAEFVNEAGETVTYDKLFEERLTTEQALKIVSENGIDTSLVRGDRAERVEQLRGEPDEQQRRREANLTQRKTEEYYNSTTPEDQMVLDMYAQLKANPRYEEAQALKNSSLTKKGFPSWQLAYNKAEDAGDTEMMQIIEDQRALGPQVGAIYDKREAWFNSQPDTVKAVLIRENPNTFGDYGAATDGAAGTPVSGGGEPGATTTTAGNGSGWIDYPDRPSSGRPWVDYSSTRPSSARASTPRASGGGGGFAPRAAGSSGFGGSSGSSPEQPVLNQILSLDPFFATGEDDGRRAIATQVSDYVSRLIGVFAMMSPDKRMGQFMTGMWMQLIGRMLGPNPDMAAWSSVLATLTKGRQGSAPPPPAPAPVVPAPTAPPAPSPASQTPTQMLGGY